MASYVPLLSCHKIYTRYTMTSQCVSGDVFNKYLLSTWLDSCGCAESVTPILNNKLLLWLRCCRCHCLNSSFSLIQPALYPNHKQPESLLYYHSVYAYARNHRKKLYARLSKQKPASIINIHKLTKKTY